MEGNITHTVITSYGYGTLHLKKGPNLPGPIFPTLHNFFRTFFYLHNYSLRDPHYICPHFFTFATPFATTTRDSCSRLHSRLPLATHVCDSTCDSHLRFTFARLHRQRMDCVDTLASSPYRSNPNPNKK